MKLLEDNIGVNLDDLGFFRYSNGDTIHKRNN